MMELRGIPRGGLVAKVTLLFCVFLCIFVVADHMAGNSSSSSRAYLEITSWRAKSQTKQLRRTEAAAWRRSRRFLMGPGSQPPQCTSRCGECAPCLPVCVPVPPRAPASASDYYPEAWRCKCGGRLYVP